MTDHLSPELEADWFVFICDHDTIGHPMHVGFEANEYEDCFVCRKPLRCVPVAALSSHQQHEGMTAALKVIEGVRHGRLAPAALDEVLQWFELHPPPQPVSGGLTPEQAADLLRVLPKVPLAHAPDPATVAILRQIAGQDTEESP